MMLTVVVVVVAYKGSIFTSDQYLRSGHCAGGPGRLDGGEGD